MPYDIQKRNSKCKHVLYIPVVSASVQTDMLNKQNIGNQNPKLYGKPKNYIQCIMVNDLPDKSNHDIWKTTKFFSKPPPLDPKESTSYTRNNLSNISSKGHKPTLIHKKFVDCIFRIKVIHNHLSKTSPKFQQLEQLNIFSILMIKTRVLKLYQKVDDMESPLYQESFSNMVSSTFLSSTFSKPQGQAPFQKNVDAFFKIANQTSIQASLSEPPPTIQQEVIVTYEQRNNFLITLKSFSKHYRKVEYAINMLSSTVSKSQRHTLIHKEGVDSLTPIKNSLKEILQSNTPFRSMLSRTLSKPQGHALVHKEDNQFPHKLSVSSDMFALFEEFVSKQEPLKKLVSIKTLQTSIIVALVNVNEIKIPDTVIQPNSSTIEHNGNWVHAQQQKPTSSFSAASSTNLSSTFGSTPISGSDSGGLDVCLFEQHSHQSALVPSIEREKYPPSKGNWPQHGLPSSYIPCSQKSKKSFCVPTPTKKATNETKQVSSKAPKKLQNEYNTPLTTKKNVGAVVVTGAPPTALKERETLEPKVPNTHPHNLLRNMLSNILSKPQGHTVSLILDPQIIVMLCLQENVLAPTQAILNNLPDPLVPNPFKVKRSRRITYINLVVNLRTSVCKSPLQTSETLSCSVIVALGNVNEIKIPHTVIQPNSSTIEQNGNWIHAQQQKPNSSFSTSRAASSTNLSSTFGSTPISGSDSGGLDLCLFEQHSHQSALVPSIEREKSPPSKGNWPQHGLPSSYIPCSQKSKKSFCVPTPTKKATNETKQVSSKAPKKLQNEYNTPLTTKKNVGAVVVTGAPPTALKERETLEPKVPNTHPHNLLRNMLSNILSKPQGHTVSLILDPQIIVMLCLQENVLAPTQAILNNLPDPLVPNPFKVKRSRRITYINLVVNLRTSVCKSPLQTSETLSCSVVVALGNVNEITLLYTVIQPNSCPIENRVCAKRQQAGSSSSMNLSSTVGSTPISGSDSGGLDLCLFEQHSHQSVQAPSIEREKSPPSKGSWPQHGPPSSCTLHRQQLVCVRTLTKKATNATKPVFSKVRKLKYNTPPTTERNVGAIVTCALKERETLEPKLPHTHPRQNSIPLSRAQLDVEKVIDCDLHTGLSDDCLAFRLNLLSCFFKMTMTLIEPLHNLLRSKLSSTLLNPQEHTESLIYNEVDPQTTVMLVANCLQEKCLALRRANVHSYQLGPNPPKVTQSRRTFYRKYLVVKSRANSIFVSANRHSNHLKPLFVAHSSMSRQSHSLTQLFNLTAVPLDKMGIGYVLNDKIPTSSSSTSHAASTNSSSTLGSTPISGSDSGGQDDEEDEEEEKKNPLPAPPAFESGLLSILIRSIDFICFVVCLWRGENMDFRVNFDMFWRVTLYPHFFEQHSHKSAQAPSIERENSSPSERNWPQHGQPSSYTLYRQQSVCVRTPTKKATNATKPKNLQNEYNTPLTTKKNVDAMVTGASPTALKECKTLEPKLPPTHPQQDSIAQLAKCVDVEKVIGCDLHTGLSEDCLVFRLNLPSCFLRMTMTLIEPYLLRSKLSSTLSNLQEHTESLIYNEVDTVMLVANCLQEKCLALRRANVHSYQLGPNPPKVTQSRRTFYRKYLVVKSRANSIFVSANRHSNHLKPLFVAMSRQSHSLTQLFNLTAVPLDKTGIGYVLNDKIPTSSSSTSHAASTNSSSTLGSTPISGSDSGGQDDEEDEEEEKKNPLPAPPAIESGLLSILICSIDFICFVVCLWRGENMDFRVNFDTLWRVTLYPHFFEQHSHKSAQAPSIERENSSPSERNWPQHGQPSSYTLYRQQSVCVRTLTKKATNATKPKNLQNEYNTPLTTKKNVDAMVTGASPTALKECKTLEPKLPPTHPQQDSIPLSRAQLAKCVDMEKVIDCDLHTGLSDDCLVFRLNLPSCFLRMTMTLIEPYLLRSTLSNPQEHTVSLIYNEVDPQTTVMLVADCLLAIFLALRRANVHSYQLGPNPPKVTQSRRTFYRKYLVVNSRANSIFVSANRHSNHLKPLFVAHSSMSRQSYSLTQLTAVPLDKMGIGYVLNDKIPTSSSSTSHAASTNSSSTLGSTPISGSDSGGQDDEEDEEEEKKNPLPAPPAIESGLLSILIRSIDFICFVVCLWRGENMDFRVNFDTSWRVMLMSLYPHFFEQHSHQSAQAPSIEREKSPSKGNWPQHGPSSYTLYRQRLVCVRTLTKKATNATKPVSSKVRKLTYNTPPTTEKNVDAMLTGASPTALKESETLEPKLPHTHPQQDSIPLSRAQLAKCVDVEKVIDCDLHTALSDDCLAFRLSLPSCFFRMTMTPFHSLLRSKLSSTLSNLQEHTVSLIYKEVDPQITVMLVANCLLAIFLALRRANLHSYQLGPNPPKATQSRTFYGKFNSCPIGQNGNRVRAKRQNPTSSSSTSHSANLSSTLGSTPISGSDSGGQDDEEDEEEEKKNPLPAPPGIESGLLSILICIINFICFVICLWRGENMDFRVRLGIFDTLWRVTLMSLWILYLRFFEQHSHQSAQASSIEEEESPPSKGKWPQHGRPSSHLFSGTLLQPDTLHRHKSKQSVSVRKKQNDVSEPPMKITTNSTKPVSSKVPRHSQNEHSTLPNTMEKVGTLVTGSLRETSASKPKLTPSSESDFDTNVSNVVKKDLSSGGVSKSYDSTMVDDCTVPIVLGSGVCSTEDTIEDSNGFSVSCNENHMFQEVPQLYGPINFPEPFSFGTEAGIELDECACVVPQNNCSGNTQHPPRPFPPVQDDTVPDEVNVAIPVEGEIVRAFNGVRTFSVVVGPPLYFPNIQPDNEHQEDTVIQPVNVLLANEHQAVLIQPHLEAMAQNYHEVVLAGGVQPVEGGNMHSVADTHSEIIEVPIDDNELINLPVLLPRTHYSNEYKDNFFRP